MRLAFFSSFVVPKTCADNVLRIRFRHGSSWILIYCGYREISADAGQRSERFELYDISPACGGGHEGPASDRVHKADCGGRCREITSFGQPDVHCSENQSGFERPLD